MPQTQVCQRFSASDSDVTIRSSDNFLFKVHRKNLAMLSEGFPGEDLPTYNEIVPLSESSATLELLFQFMYPQPLPDLEDLPFTNLEQLAEAAEKYSVYAAMAVCKIYMRRVVGLEPLAVLSYAVKHGYQNIADEAAPLTLQEPRKDALRKLGAATFITWTLYHGMWTDVLLEAHRKPRVPMLHPGAAETCQCWYPFYEKVISTLGNATGLLTFGALIDHNNPLLYTCSGTIHCIKRADLWRNNITAKIDAIPKFSNIKQD
ncbi:hypothetical protein BV25DRAFT_1283534 [Artomyces pyxidatus]|uniref:Uncharacterized protein n=1 Tax=Artomyces pyxidatus TaxID=48021 RepID=A0ACB8SQU6_9AGAM|nr:hypothetical protein BV25DRAFT_1283534 [Artomyces pyxidatus]